MSYAVDFTTVSTVGLESSPVADALAGLRANEARYFKNKYDHDFTVEPAERRPRRRSTGCTGSSKEERDIVIASPPLEATDVRGRGHPMGLRVLRERALDQRDVHARRPREAGRRVQALRRDGGPRRSSPRGSSSRGRSRSWPGRSAARTSSSRASTDRDWRSTCARAPDRPASRSSGRPTRGARQRADKR